MSPFVVPDSCPFCQSKDLARYPTGESRILLCNRCSVGFERKVESGEPVKELSFKETEITEHDLRFRVDTIGTTPTGR